ncbi:uncharacterized protein LOC127746475 isoform X2 [Arachis duranensis]|uniref:Uncharacterized protein LOC127746475 isoform X2 n=1 Tax=Arachis duranensis TaxID=130453 RepID=A0A9C6WHG3_ARADU|nr:uncharacterized protein LOC127746475 isoform X2 [Arachis duranensis]
MIVDAFSSQKRHPHPSPYFGRGQRLDPTRITPKTPTLGCASLTIMATWYPAAVVCFSDWLRIRSHVSELVPKRAPFPDLIYLRFEVSTMLLHGHYFQKCDLHHFQPLTTSPCPLPCPFVVRHCPSLFETLLSFTALARFSFNLGLTRFCMLNSSDQLSTIRILISNDARCFFLFASQIVATCSHRLQSH